MATHTVTTTNQPGRSRDVDDRELVDLERMGLLASYDKGPLAGKVKLNTERQQASASATIEQHNDLVESGTDASTKGGK